MNRVQFGGGACEKTRRYMDAYISNELLVETNHEMLRHLESCAVCSAELETRGRLRSCVKRAVQSQSAPPDLAVRVRERIRGRQSSVWHAASWTRWALASAAGVAICIAALLSYTRRPQLPELADRAGQERYIQRVSATVVAVFKSGLGDHIHCAVFRKYPQNPPTLQEMEAKLGPDYRGLLALAVPAVPAGYRVVMAHQCSYGGRRFVHLAMRKGTDLISVVVTLKNAGETLGGLAPAINASGVPVYQSVALGYQVAGFESERYLAFVVSGLDGRRNLQIAAALAAPVRRLLS